MTRFRGLVVLTLTAGCFYSPPNPPVDFRGLTDGPDPCLLGGGMFVGGRSVSVGLPYDIDLRRAPIPSNSSEAFAFSHLFDALVRLDCNGRVGPGLAKTWRALDGGRRWIFEIDTAMTFWNGDAVTAPVIREALLRNQNLATPGVRPNLGGMTLTTVDLLRLEVELPHPVRLPSLFADPVFAVMYGDEGTGRYALDTAQTGSLFLRSRQNMLPDLALRFGEDARDLIDARADLLATTDRAIARYAKSRRDFDSYPLKWSVRYVLLAGDGFPTLSGTPGFRERLALEAVRADARGAEGTAWWESIRFCPIGPEAGQPRTRARRREIIYDADDAVARDLAQRVAAISRGSSRGLPLPEVEAAIKGGTAAAVFAMPIEFSALCLLSAEWLNALRTYRIDPLVDVRPYLVKAFLGPGAFASRDGGFEFRLSRGSGER